jgi:hypothetical protein
MGNINEYSEESEIVYERIEQYRANGLSDEKVVGKMESELHINPDLLKFLLKNSKCTDLFRFVLDNKK